MRVRDDNGHQATVKGEVYLFHDDDYLTLEWVAGTNAFRLVDSDDGEDLGWCVADEAPTTMEHARVIAGKIFQEIEDTFPEDD
jgi:hypothetical protein